MGRPEVVLLLEVLESDVAVAFELLVVGVVCCEGASAESNPS